MFCICISQITSMSSNLYCLWRLNKLGFTWLCHCLGPDSSTKKNQILGEWGIVKKAKFGSEKANMKTLSHSWPTRRSSASLSCMVTVLARYFSSSSFSCMSVLRSSVRFSSSDNWVRLCCSIRCSSWREK